MSGLPEDVFDVRDPGWFPHGLEVNAARVGFVRASREALSAEPFLDHRWRGVEALAAELPLSELQTGAARPPSLGFIWHTSYCGSTLLSACLDHPGRSLVLKEPRILVILAALKRSGRPGLSALAQKVFELLGRRFQAGEQVLVKPANTANALIPDAARLTEGRMLLLYSDCESFMLSMAREGRAGFSYVRELFRSLAAEGHPAGRWPAVDLLRLTDLDMAALVWRMQMDALEAVSAQLGDRARSLDSRVFLEGPAPVLRRADEFLGLGIGPGRIDEIAAGPLFGRDLKHPGRSFDPRRRAEEKARLKERIGADVQAVIGSFEGAFPSPPRLAAPL
jgi:hypothetical protein